MPDFTHEHAQHLIKRTKSLRVRLDAMKERLRGGTQKIVRTGEVCAGAFAGGMLQGHAGPDGMTIVHVPVDLAAGVALNVLGILGAAGDYSDHLSNVGDGFLGAYLSSVGFAAGKKWQERGSLFGHKDTASLPPASKVSGVSQSQMADLVSQMR